MRALVQRVTRARCTVGGRVTGEIETGFVALVGAGVGDEVADADWLARKVAGLRVFADSNGLMNLDVGQVGGAVLAVPQFTLYGDVRRGRRPDFLAAARPERGEPLFARFCDALAREGVRVERGVFRAHMEIELVNDGPVTLWLESPRAPERAGASAPGPAGGVPPDA